ncbi:MAG: exodeoxyribonuclease V subunit gamma [Neisseria sp.]|nr:exodeoxyribonuclease V subunit gamma [Neisseria sp.]
MALTLHQSNRIEYLAEVLATLAAIPPREVFAPEEILVAAGGMRRFVDLTLAQKLGVAANVRYGNVPAFFWRIMFACLPDMPQENVYAPQVLRWRMLAALQQAVIPEVQAALGSYLGAYDTAAYELSQELANLFDQYLVYRPQWVDAWSRGELNGLGADEAWQAALWRHLRAGIDSPHRVALWRELRAFLTQPQLPPSVRLPERVFVFGISTLAPVYLGLLEALAQHCDVHILALNPCADYWGDVRSAAQFLRDAESPPECSNPLLASLGKQGRDFFDMLTELNPLAGKMLFADETTTPGLLQRLQHDIQTLRTPTAATAQANDGSVMLVSAYSTLRELQALKDAVIQFLDEHPDCTPDDIAVLSPDIEAYVPFIEAVFGRSAADAIALPYSISDTKVSRGEPYLQAWEMLLTLFASRFEIGAVLPLADNECVLRRFDLTREDVPLLQRILRETCVHWAWDEAERKRVGGTEAVFTWTQSIDRTVAGLLLPAASTLWQSLAPFACDIELLPTLSRCIDLLETLAAARDAWQDAATPQAWAERIRHIGANLLDAGNASAAVTFAAQLDGWLNECAAADMNHALSAATVQEHMRRWLSAPADSGFLRGGITFGSLIPLRNLPFAFLALLGMNDGAFPRASRHTPFDLMNTHPQKGDRSRRDDDRYLFLESVMSARCVLYLSYIGRDIRNNEPLAPSELLCELGDTLALMSATHGDYLAQHTRQHPLQPFSPQYFSGSLITHRSDYAAALNAPPQSPAAFFEADVTAAASEDFTRLTWEDFIRFWKNPPRTWLQRTLSWRSLYEEQAWDDAEPFSVNDEEAVYLAYMDARRTHTDFDAVDGRLRAQSLYPAACLGELERAAYRQAVAAMDSTWFTAQPLPPQVFCVDFATETPIRLSGSLNHLTAHGQIFLRGKPSNAPQQVADYLQHLIACAALSAPPVTVIACPQATVVLPEIAADEARARLHEWCAAYLVGQQGPLPFFARTGLAAARAMVEGKNTEAVITATRAAWFGNQKSLGQCDYPEVKAVFARDEILPIEQPLFHHYVTTLLLPAVNIIGAQDNEEPADENL